MADPTAALVAKLESAGYDPRPTGPDSWESRCPAHNGARRNLSICRSEDGRVLIHCQAHDCSPEAIVQPLALTMGDLFPSRDGQALRPARNGKAKSKAHARSYP